MYVTNVPGGATINVNDAEYNALVLGLDALMDEWVDAGQPNEGYDWISVVDRMRAVMASSVELMEEVLTDPAS